MSILPTFFDQLFLYDSQTSSFFVLKFRLDSFGRKEIGAKVAHKMLVKLTKDVGEKTKELEDLLIAEAKLLAEVFVYIILGAIQIIRDTFWPILDTLLPHVLF